jgi:two-component system NtrC family response regulator/two-component system response regulator AtoC
VKPAAFLLLVDDDEAFRKALARELGRVGYEVATADSGAAALDRVAEREPDVVLLDLRLPDRDGLEVLEAIRATSPGTDVIMLTGHGSIDTAIQ